MTVVPEHEVEIRQPVVKLVQFHDVPCPIDAYDGAVGMVFGDECG